jgi:hypothetical protein
MESGGFFEVAHANRAACGDGERDLEETLIELNRGQRGRLTARAAMGIDPRSGRRRPLLAERDPREFWHVANAERTCERRQITASGLCGPQIGVCNRAARCTSERPMRTYTLHSAGRAVGAHEVSIPGDLTVATFGSASTMCIAAPHPGQVGCHSSSAVHAFGSGGGVALSWIAGTICCWG